jgi:uncharacterized protein (TIGR02246 family)
MDMQTAAPHSWTPYSAGSSSSSPLAAAEEGIRETCDRVADAWSRGDASALSAVLADDCDHVTLSRVRQVKRGRGALVESWRRAFSRRGPDFSVRMSVATHMLRLLRDDLALVDGAFEYSDGIGAADIHQGRSSQAFSAVMTCDGHEWVVVALRVGPSTTAAKVVPCSDEVSS